MNGLSSKTSKKIYDEYDEYVPSSEVTAAKKALSDYEANNNPTGNARSQQASSLLDAYLNRGSYNSNVYNTDLYKRFEANALKNGKIAANNAAAEAAALSGGYGNSYGVSAAAAANQRYVDSINDYALQLDQMNYNRWKDEGDLAYNKYAAANSAYQQMLEDYYTNRDYLANRAQQEYANDYGRFGDSQNYWSKIASAENSDYWNQTQLAENQRQYDATLAENQRQYNASLAEKQRQFDNEMTYNYYKTATGGSSRKSVTSKMYDEALNAYLNGGSAGLDRWYDKQSAIYNSDELDSILDYVAKYSDKEKRLTPADIKKLNATPWYTQAAQIGSKFWKTGKK